MTTTCPHCHSPLTVVGQFHICPTHGQVELSVEKKALRIFLSYGHDRNRPLVDKIKNFLEGRGHKVWIDNEQIKQGDEWRNRITQGIQESDSILAFLSKHSVRQPGVCRDEIGIALGCKTGWVKTILVEQEKDVEPPSSVSHIQWLDLQQWQEEFQNESWINDKLEQIATVLESSENKNFSGEISTLDLFLSPKGGSILHSFLNRTFVGRVPVIDAIESWRKDLSSRLCWVKGGPGTGKSALSAYLAHYGKSVVVATHFCDWGNSALLSPKQLVCNIAFQLATRLPDYRSLLIHKQNIPELVNSNEANLLFDELLTNLLNFKIDGEQESYIILIDALDEASSNGVNAIADMLKHNVNRLPKWVKFLVTSRPEIEIETPLKNLGQITVLDLDTAYSDIYSDSAEYITLKLEHLPHFADNKELIIAEIHKKSEGVFLYVEAIVNEIQSGVYHLNQLDRLPQGMNDYYHKSIKRRFLDIQDYKANARKALSLIASCFEPLPLSLLGKMMVWDALELQDFESTLGALVKKKEDCLVPFHKSLFDWLTSDKAGTYKISAEYGHQRIISYAWGQIKNQKLDSYLKKNLPLHLIEFNDWEKLHLILNEGFVIDAINQQIFKEYANYLSNTESALAEKRIFYFLENQLLTSIFPDDNTLIQIITTLLKCNCNELIVKLITQIEKNNDISSRLTGHITIFKAKIALETDQPNQALLLYKSIVEKENMGDVDLLTVAYHGIALVHHNFGNYQEEYDYLNKSLELYQANKDKAGCSNIYHQIGSVFSRQGDYIKAKEYYDTSIAISQELGNKNKEYITKHELAGINTSLGNYTLAIQQLDEELSYVGICLGYRSLGSINYEKGKALSLQGRCNEAIETLEKSLSTFKIIEDSRGISLALSELGRTYTECDNFEEAGVALAEALAIAESINYERGIIYTNLYILELHLKKGGLSEVEASLEQFSLMVENFDDLQLKCRSHLLFADYELHMKNPKDAGFHYKKAERIGLQIKYKRGVAFAKKGLAVIEKQFGNTTLFE